MHRIDSLEIFGFKSFCEKTNLILNGEVTAIVGPNGCGKSNVADAINWVLGEQSTKSLRAGKMDDVIFGGTQQRKALGLAEVTLTLREFGNGGPVNFTLADADAQVAVSRRLYRSGESEYFLNGRRCRLRDVYEFFEGTGLGSTSYALIEQGRIELILSARPQDRRGLIEEAARISVFKTKRKAAEMKLELAKQNLARVNDIIYEVDRQIASLKRQAAKARRYYRLRDEQIFFSGINFYNRRQRLTAEVGRIGELLGTLTEEERALAGRLEMETVNRRRLLEEFERMESDLDGWREELSGIRIEEERSHQQSAYQQSRLQSLHERVDDMDRTLSDSVARADRLRGETAHRQTALEDLDSEISLGEAEALSFSERIQQTTGQIETRESELNALRSSSLGEVEQLADLRNRQGRADEGLEKTAAQKSHLDEECRRLLEEQEALAARRRRLEAELNGTALALEELRRQLAEAEAEAKVLEKEATAGEADLQANTHEIESQQHRLAFLEEIEAGRANYAEGVQHFLNAADRPQNLAIAGTLADFIETEPRLENAVEAFMDPHLQHVIVRTLEDAVRSLRFISDQQTGRCSFLLTEPLHQPTPEDGPACHIPEPLAASVIGPLHHWLRIPEPLQSAVRHSFPELAGVLVVSNLDAAVALARLNSCHTFLTLQGDVISGRGLVSACGERKPGLGLLSLRRQRKEIATRIEQGQLDRAAVAERLSRLRRRLAANSRNRQELNEQWHQRELEQSSLTPQLDQVMVELSRLAAQLSVADRERQQLESEQASLAAEIQAIALSVLAMESAGRLRAERLLELEAVLPPLRQGREEILHSLGEQKVQLAAKIERRRALALDLERRAEQMLEQATQVDKMRRELAEAHSTIEQLRKSNEELQVKCQGLAEARVQMEERLQTAQAKGSAHKSEAREIEERLKAGQEHRRGLMEKRTQLEVEKARSENDLQHLQASCREEFQEDLDSLVSRLTEEQRQHDPDEAERRHQEVKEKLQAAGAINMTALEEYRELEQRHAFLLSQQTDIQSAIEGTEEALAEINRRSAEQFKETFNAINRNFQELFGILFGGGQCEMRLLDDADILESGIEIIAQPPGKRLQNVMLLSGGEKALVALALLLGIFRFRPSPFCLLDEVDAPLDDANILRFTRLLVEMGKNTQFILITHNKRTMEMAQYLYGVTMEEAGVSKVVSVRFN